MARTCLSSWAVVDVRVSARRGVAVDFARLGADAAPRDPDLEHLLELGVDHFYGDATTEPKNDGRVDDGFGLRQSVRAKASVYYLGIHSYVPPG